MQGNVCAVLQKIVPGSSTGIFVQVLAILLALGRIGGGCAPEPCDNAPPSTDRPLEPECERGGVTG